MYVCMYIRMYIYIHTYIHTYIYAAVALVNAIHAVLALLRQYTRMRLYSYRLCNILVCAYNKAVYSCAPRSSLIPAKCTRLHEIFSLHLSVHLKVLR